MASSRFLAILAAWALMIALVSGGLMHAVVPHTHGDGHTHSESSESPIWTSLHHGLSNEQKKFIALTTLTLGFLLATPRIFIAIILLSATLVSVRDPNAGEQLRRGILPHRKFT